MLSFLYSYFIQNIRDKSEQIIIAYYWFLMFFFVQYSILMILVEAAMFVYDINVGAAYVCLGGCLVTCYSQGRITA